MEERYIKIIAKIHNKDPNVLVIKKQLKNMKKVLGGEIDIIPYKDVLLVIPANTKINKEQIDLKNLGSSFITGNDTKNSDFKSLKVKQINTYLKELGKERGNDYEQ